ncbi:Oxidoreductase [Rhizophlyctis rosea]|nr:Oxidoreductase [Rhizophlyctis rosea]
MSYARQEEDGKDILLFVTKEDHDTLSSSSSDSPSATSSSSADPKSPSSGAYNPETGEIDWDCPCLGPMTQPPCGETFKAAFSCFVYSTQEPKGVDCIEQFRLMQECFRQHPDIYGEELGEDAADDDDDDDDEKEGGDKKEAGDAEGAAGEETNGSVGTASGAKTTKA